MRNGPTDEEIERAEQNDPPEFNEPYEDSDRQVRMRRVKEVLRSLGVNMSVCGCGCCGSPTVTFKFEGETILEAEDFVNIDTEETE